MFHRASTTATLPYSFFYNATATPEIYTLSLHDALPISPRAKRSSRMATASTGGPAGRSGPAGRPNDRKAHTATAMSPPHNTSVIRVMSSHPPPPLDPIRATSSPLLPHRSLPSPGIPSGPTRGSGRRPQDARDLWNGAAKLARAGESVAAGSPAPGHDGDRPAGR